MILPAILALDPATTVGWAIAGPDRSCGLPCPDCIKHGTLDLGATKSRAVRGLAFARWLAETISTEQIGVIAFEAPAIWSPSGAQRRLSGGLAMLIEVQAERMQAAILELQPGEWRRSIGLKGNAKKPDVMAAVVGLGHDPATQDEADAIAILLHAAMRIRK